MCLSNSSIIAGTISSKLPCWNNYECQTNLCLNGICTSPDECQQNNDCDDQNPCTEDSCSGIPKKCSNNVIMNGCNSQGTCIPVGTRVEGYYCDINNELKAQNALDVNCNNNYECASNVCVNNQCIKPSILRKILDWFSRLFG